MKSEKTRYGSVLPPDLVFDILTRLPVKSLSRFRSVCKLWCSIISDPSFVNSHLTRSKTRPTLLISSPNKRHAQRLFFTAHHVDKEGQGPANAIHNQTLPGFVGLYVSQSLNGLICLDIGSRLKICNPITGHTVSLPPTQTQTPHSSSSSCYCVNSFGFDPLTNQHKVLNTWIITTDDPNNKLISEHRVFTLGSDSWRQVDGDPPHFPTDSICCDGAIYYRAWVNMTQSHLGHRFIVAFDVGVEKFRIAALPNDAFLLGLNSALIQCGNRVALVDYEYLRDGNNMDLWVLEDFSNQVWSKKSIVFPSYWKDIQEDRDFFLAGTITTGEILLAPRSLSNPFYLFCYDMKRNSVRRVEITGLPEYGFNLGDWVTISVTSHVESILSLRELHHC